MKQMTIKMVYPDNEKDLKELQDRIDKIHAKMIIDSINKLELPYADKVDILEKVIEQLRNESE